MQREKKTGQVDTPKHLSIAGHTFAAPASQVCAWGPQSSNSGTLQPCWVPVVVSGAYMGWSGGLHLSHSELDTDGHRKQQGFRRCCREGAGVWTHFSLRICPFSPERSPMMRAALEAARHVLFNTSDGERVQQDQD